MAALFTAASSQYLSNAAPPLNATGYGFSVGAWINLATTGTQRCIFALTDTATTNNFLELRVLSTNILSIGAAAGGTTISTDLTTAITANSWVFVLGRFANSIRRSVSMMTSDGLVQSVSPLVTSRAPAGLDMLTIGGFKTSAAAAEFWDGLIGELWYCNGDVWPDNGVVPSDSFVRKLAYGGVFAISHANIAVYEYHSYFDDVVTPEIGQDYNSGPLQTWVNNNGVTLGTHPPLPYWYARPGQSKRKLVV